MNVLEAILGGGDEAKDDFDNEIANTTNTKRSKHFSSVFFVLENRFLY